MRRWERKPTVLKIFLTQLISTAGFPCCILDAQFKLHAAFLRGSCLYGEGGIVFFFVLSNAYAIRSGSPRSRTPGQSGGYKICRAKSWQFPPGMVEFSKQSPLVQVSLNEKCPWDLPHITWIFWSRRIFTKVIFFLISATGIKTCDLQTILKQCAWQILP